MKKLFAVLLVVAMVLSLGVTAFADGQIKIADPPANVSYNAYKIFSADGSTGEVVYTNDTEWANILFTTDENGNTIGKADPIKFKVNGTTVTADEGYSAAKFAEWIMTNVDLSGLTAVASSAPNTDGDVLIENLQDGYYLIVPMTSTSDGKFTYAGEEETLSFYDWDRKTTAEKAVYGSNNCYYNDVDDPNHQYIVTQRMYDLLADKTGYVTGNYYTRKAAIDKSDFEALPAAEQENYSSNAATYQFTETQAEITEDSYNALDAAQKPLYDSFKVHYLSGQNDGAYVTPEVYNAMGDTQRALYNSSASTRYKTKTIIPAKAYMDLGQSADSTVRALQAKYSPVTDPDGTPVVDTTKTPALTTVLDGQTVYVQNKNDMPLDKQVDTDGDDEYDDDETSVKVDDTLNYKIKTKIPTTYADNKYEYEFLITDKMSKGLTFNNDIQILIGDEENPDIEITLDNTGITALTKNGAAVEVTSEEAIRAAIGDTFEVVAATNDKTLSGNEIRYGANGYTFELSFNVAAQVLRQYAGEDLTIKYSANVTAEALGTLIQNVATLDYTDEQGLHSKDSETDNYMARIVVDKFETGNREQKLAGAKFVLYKLYDANDPDFYGMDAEDAYGEPTRLYYTYDDTNESTGWTETPGSAYAAETDGNGFAEFRYVPDGTYYLKETEAPTNYKLLMEDIRVVVDGSDAVDNRLSQSQRDAILNPVAHVANTPGSTMPSTGGVGATLLTIGGVALMLAAGAFLVLRRRKEQE